MKNTSNFLLGACFLFQLIACEYLDVVPDERAQESDTYNTANAVKAYLYSCYGFMPSSRDWPGSYWIPEEVTAVSNELFTNLKRGVYSRYPWTIPLILGEIFGTVSVSVICSSPYCPRFLQILWTMIQRNSIWRKATS